MASNARRGPQDRKRSTRKNTTSGRPRNASTAPTPGKATVTALRDYYEKARAIESESEWQTDWRNPEPALETDSRNCPCIVFGRVSERLKLLKNGQSPHALESRPVTQDCVSLAVSWFGCYGCLIYAQRTELRNHYNIKDDGYDCKRAWCDPFLAIAQHEGEILHRADKLEKEQPQPEPAMTTGQPGHRIPRRPTVAVDAAGTPLVVAVPIPVPVVIPVPAPAIEESSTEASDAEQAAASAEVSPGSRSVNGDVVVANSPGEQSHPASEGQRSPSPGSQRVHFLDVNGRTPYGNFSPPHTIEIDPMTLTESPYREHSISQDATVPTTTAPVRHDIHEDVVESNASPTRSHGIQDDPLATEATASAPHGLDVDLQTGQQRPTQAHGVQDDQLVQTAQDTAPHRVSRDETTVTSQSAPGHHHLWNDPTSTTPASTAHRLSVDAVANRESSRGPSREASRGPSRQTSRPPSRQTSRQPSREPSRQPSRESSRQASVQGSREPSREPTPQPPGAFVAQVGRWRPR